jgi:hypothetical protein
MTLLERLSKNKGTSSSRKSTRSRAIRVREAMKGETDERA